MKHVHVKVHRNGGVAVVVDGLTAAVHDTWTPAERWHVKGGTLNAAPLEERTRATATVLSWFLNSLAPWLGYAMGAMEFES